MIAILVELSGFFDSVVESVLGHQGIVETKSSQTTSNIDQGVNAYIYT
jgi:hypothetical protein